MKTKKKFPDVEIAGTKYSGDPALSMGAVIQLIGRMDRSQLSDVGEALKERWAILSDEAKSQLSVGDIVWFNARRRGTIYGKITHFNRKRIGVLATSGLKWKVSPQLLNVVSDKKRADEIRKLLAVAPHPEAQAFADLLGGLGGRRNR